MRVSIICKELSRHGIVSTSVIMQARYFISRGDIVRIFTEQCVGKSDADISQITQVLSLIDLLRGEPHYALSDLLIYHYDEQYQLAQSIRGVEHGVTLFHYHSVQSVPLGGITSGAERGRRDYEGLALIHYSDYGIVDSPFDKNFLTQQFQYDADHLFTLPIPAIGPQGPRRDKLTPLAETLGLDNQKVLLYAGDLTPLAQPDMLIDTLMEVRNAVSNIKLILVSNHAYSVVDPQTIVNLRSLISRQGLSNDVLIIDSPEQLLDYYQLADIYITLHRNDGNAAALVLAMACGIPCVAIDAGAYSWALGDQQFTTVNKPSELAHQVQLLLQDEKRRSEITNRYWEQAQPFMKDKFAANMEAIISKVVFYTLPSSMLQIPATTQISSSANTDVRVSMREIAALQAIQKSIDAHADIALRGYVVRSRIPVIGRLVAWLRRNSTSHLREPYLDVMIERQVVFNQQTAAWMKQMTSILAMLAPQQESNQSADTADK